MSLARLIPPLPSVLLAVTVFAGPALSADPRNPGCDVCRIIEEKSLSLDLAQAIAQAALAKCRVDGNHVSVTVVDRDGLVKIASRDDVAGPHTIVTSQRKAFTSLTFKQLSGQWAHRVLTDPALAGLKDTAGTIALGGGMPIKAGNEVIGSIASAGRRTPTRTRPAPLPASRRWPTS